MDRGIGVKTAVVIFQKWKETEFWKLDRKLTLTLRKRVEQEFLKFNLYCE